MFLLNATEIMAPSVISQSPILNYWLFMSRYKNEVTVVLFCASMLRKLHLSLFRSWADFVVPRRAGSNCGNQQQVFWPAA